MKSPKNWNKIEPLVDKIVEILNKYKVTGQDRVELRRCVETIGELR